jgi:hypothetical protein
VPKLGSVWKLAELSLTVRRTSRKRVEEVLIQTARGGAEMEVAG